MIAADGRLRAVDSGFHRAQRPDLYPQLLRLFAELGVRTRPAEMSMSITCATCGLSYAGVAVSPDSWHSHGGPPIPRS